MDGEFDFIDWVRRRTPAADRVMVGPGDDCAVLSPGDRPLLVTTDMLMDGVDFHLCEVGPRRAGRKAMAVNLSDIAAMAGRPTAAVVSVALPRDGGDPSPQPPPRGGEGEPDQNLAVAPPRLGEGLGRGLSTRELAEELFLGLRDAADAFAVPIVGGDTNTWAESLVISVTVLGEATGRGPVPRSGASPGDWLFVTGPLGGSLLGHHLDFTPRVREALALHAAVELKAMQDISDGLSADLRHILTASRCGAVLTAEAIPVSAAAIERSRTSGRSPLDHALTDGEDFELIFAVSAADGAKLRAAPPVPVWKIGECVPDGLWLEEGGVRRPLTPAGWAHSFGAAGERPA